MAWRQFARTRQRSPERGKANAAVEKLVAQALKLLVAAVRVCSGKTSAHKVLEITGLTKSDIIKRPGKR